jgi:hypothetical protein
MASETGVDSMRNSEEPDIDHETAEQYLSRALDFMHGAGTLCSVGGQEWLPSSALLIAQAMELVGKRRLILKGAPKAELSRPPNNHDLQYLWGDTTGLRDEARQIASELQKNPSPNGVTATFDFDLHFDTLAEAHSNRSGFSLRYHQGTRTFADPKAFAVILNVLMRRERAR